jgi:chromodomain-helicase-DNA-binding protein 4
MSTFRQLRYKKTDSSPKFDSDLGEYEMNEQEESDEGDFAEVYSDIVGPPKKRKRRAIQLGAPGGKRRILRSRDRSPGAVEVRRSGRTTKLVKNMKERGEDEIWADEDSDVGPPKAVGVREVFKSLPRNDQFRLRHRLHCDACGDRGDSSQKGILVYCQGCTVSYHRVCLGPRNGRDHLVTKIGDGDFVLQCRRCIGAARKKEATAPRLERCQVCKTVGSSCVAFREKKTPKQEEKEREENSGQDPITQVDSKFINNADNVLFRCCHCMRAFHFPHLPSRADDHNSNSNSGGSDAEQRYREYSYDWACVECVNKPGKVQALVAWRPVDEDEYDAGDTVEMVDDDKKEYLIKWEHHSYFKCQWMPGPWVWGVAKRAMRKAFAKKTNSQNLPTMKSEDAIPEDYLRVDVVLDVKYTSYVSVRAEQIDKARIKEVERAFVKYKGLGYEEAVWEEPPSPEDGERWTDFVTAYEDWVMASYVHLPKSRPMEKRIEKVRSMDFESDLMKKEQPSILTGGDMMAYQMEGLNWLYYKWHKCHSAILADEMGLGNYDWVTKFLLDKFLIRSRR